MSKALAGLSAALWATGFLTAEALAAPQPPSPPQGGAAGVSWSRVQQVVGYRTVEKIAPVLVLRRSL